MESARVIDNQHNNPPPEWEILPERLAQNYSELIDRQETLKANAQTLPEVVSDERESVWFTDVVNTLVEWTKEAKNAHEREKEPHLKCGRVVDNFFNARVKELDGIKENLQRRQGLYLKKIDDEKRRKAEEAEAALRAESERRAQDAAALEAIGATEAAAKAVDEAIRAEDDANSLRVVPVSARTIGTTGAVSSLKQKMIGRIVDRNKLNLEALRPYLSAEVLQKAVDAYVRAGYTQLDGAVIEPDYTARTR